MSPRTRALLIGMFGPVLQAVGVTWDILDHAVFERAEVGQLTLTHIFTGPAHLIIIVGFALSLVCIPIALQVATARPEQFEAPEDQAEEPTFQGIPLKRAEASK